MEQNLCIEQHAHGAQVPMPGCLLQCCPALVISMVHKGALLQQQLDHLWLITMAVKDRLVGELRRQYRNANWYCARFPGCSSTRPLPVQFVAYAGNLI